MERPTIAPFDGHDDLVARARRAATSIDLAAAAGAFVVGLSQTWPRGLTLLGSLAAVRHLPDHGYVPYDGPMHGQLIGHHPDRSPLCAVCGTGEASPYGEALEFVPGDIQKAAWEGCYPAWGLAGWTTDLEDAAGLDIPSPTDADRAVLRRVVDVLRGLPTATSGSAADKALAAAKALPKPVGYSGRGGPARRRRNTLMVLSDVGVLGPTEMPSYLDRWTTPAELVAVHESLGVSFRNDTPYTLIAWRGGVDEARIAELFGDV